MVACVLFSLIILCFSFLFNGQYAILLKDIGALVRSVQAAQGLSFPYCGGMPCEFAIEPPLPQPDSRPGEISGMVAELLRAGIGEIEGRPSQECSGSWSAGLAAAAMRGTGGHPLSSGLAGREGCRGPER